MDDSKNHEKIPDIDTHRGSVQNRAEFLRVDRENHANERNHLIDMVKYTLLCGAEKVLMARKWSLPVCETKNKDMQGKEKVCEKYHHEEIIVSNGDYVDGLKVVTFSEFPLNFLAFLVILVLKIIGFQISLFTSFFTLPIWLSYSTFMFVMFPFQTLTRIRNHFTARFLRMWGQFYSSITSFIFSQLKSRKLVLNMATRFGSALFWSIYVYFVLVGLLVLGFVLGALTMRRIVEKPVQSINTLDFDYTKPNPVAYVPIKSSTSAVFSSGLISKDGAKNAENVGIRIIPYNHQLQLTVSLTLPESEYNRKLGIFQVRVEFLSVNGKVTMTSRHACMLRFKSQPIRLVETAFKSAPLLAGFQSEAQTLNIKIRKFTEGYEPTTCLRVVLEQRAEYQSGEGIPQIYAASLALESELPKLKMMIWYWRRTIFVWISFMSFLTELVVVLIFFRPLILPRLGSTVVGEKKFHRNKISWCKSI